MKQIFSTLIVTFLLVSFTSFSQSQEIDFSDVLSYRNMGPHRVGAWISSIAKHQSTDPAYQYTYYVAGRYGGVWKTINNGTTFNQVFDEVGISSIGAVAVSSVNPEIVYVGTGEAYGARSTHAGRGVYKSINGGKSWINLGLEDTQHISTLIIHPTNPDIVYVAAMGHLFTPNEDRGIFKTIDGGKSWEKVLYIDKNTGVIDLIIDPSDANILYAASYEKYRYPWHFEAGGLHSAIYKSIDSGQSWNKLTTDLPSGKLGRIGLALCAKQPNIVYAVVENLNAKPGVIIDENIKMNQQRDPYYDQMIGGEIYRTDDKGSSWKKMNEDDCNVSAKAAYSFNKIMVNPDNPEEIFVTSDGLLYSLDAGRTWENCKWGSGELFYNMFGDYRTFWVNPKDGRHMMFGSDGGLYETFDGGMNVNHKYQIPLGEIYIVETDNSDPYNIYLGLQDHDAWKAPINSWSGQVGPEDWILYGLWDGMYTRVDKDDNRWAYISTQFGGHHRIDQLTGERENIQPINKDKNNPYRFPWTPPIEISPHDSKVIYTGGQMLLRSLDQGEHWEEISPDLTTNNAKKIAGRGHMMYCTITTISESSYSDGLIWVGTDDGRVHFTRNHGNNWTEVTDQIAALGGKKDYWVTRIIASKHDAGTAYVCKSGFRNDDFTPLVFKTTDFGESWVKITNGISQAPVNVIIEDPNNKNILYLGNDEGVFVSLNAGEQWQSFRQDMPIVSVKDLTIQEREQDLIVGTYGRGAYVTDISLLNQLSEEFQNREAILFEVESKPIKNFSDRAYWGNYELSGSNHINTPNEAGGLSIYYFLKDIPNNNAWIEVFNIKRQVSDTLNLKKVAGLQKIQWQNREASIGTYFIRLHTDTGISQQETILRPAPIWPVGRVE